MIDRESHPWAPVKLRGPRHRLPGRLIGVDGSDGSGKSHFVAHLIATLRDRGPCTHVQMPGAHLRAYRYWQAWHDMSMGIEMSRISDVGLSVMAVGDRLVQQDALIVPALEQGHVVVCERYALTPLVFERGLPYAGLLQRLYRPDLGVLFDAPVEVMAQRVTDRSEDAVYRQTRQEKEQEVQRFRVLAEVNDYVVVDTTSTDGYAELEPLLTRLLFDTAR